MNTTLRKCIDCGRLFAAQEGVQQCQNCSADERTVYKRIEDAVTVDKLDSVAAIAVDLGVDSGMVRRVLADMPYLASQVQNDELCPRCGIRAAVIGKDYCSACLMDLSADLRDMAGAIGSRPESSGRNKPYISHASIAKALREKRRRTGHHRFNPVPPNVKGNG